MRRQYFTLAQVNALVPQLTEIMGRAVQLHALLTRSVRALAELGVRADHDVLAGKREVNASLEAQPKLTEARALYDAILEDAAAVEALGGEVKAVDQGLVDFWSYLDGEKEVLLCWRLGERRFAYYHTPEAGFAGRQPVDGHLFASQQENSLRQ